jgi:hypothetical protein
MLKKLTLAYGKSDSSDFLMSRSIWDEPRDWMQALANRERFLMAVWNKKVGALVEPPLLSVALVATALETSSGFISVEYEFDNNDAAEKEIADLEDDVL